MQPVTPGRYPLEPLADMLGCTAAPTQGERTDLTAHGTSVDLAQRLNVSERTIRNYRRNGLTSRQADSYAIHLAHLHPSQLWPHWFDDQHIAADCDWPEHQPASATGSLHV